MMITILAFAFGAFLIMVGLIACFFMGACHLDDYIEDVPVEFDAKHEDEEKDGD